MARVITCWP